MIGTDCICSCKSNYHIITTTTALKQLEITIYHLYKQKCNDHGTWCQDWTWVHSWHGDSGMHDANVVKQSNISRMTISYDLIMIWMRHFGNTVDHNRCGRQRVTSWYAYMAYSLTQFYVKCRGNSPTQLVRCQLREDGLWSLPPLKAPITTGYQIRPLFYVACLVVNPCFVFVSIMDSTDYTDGVDHAVQIHAFYKPIILKENA
jgi:hypothetical protein